MKRQWSEQELGHRWSVTHDEFELLKHRTGRSRIGFITLLKFFSIEGRFPKDRREVPLATIEYLADQVGVKPESFASYKLTGRSCERDRAHIRSLFGFNPATVDDAARLSDWLKSEVLPIDHKPVHIQAAALEWLRESKLEPPSSSRLDRAVSSAFKAFEEEFFANSHD